MEKYGFVDAAYFIGVGICLSVRTPLRLFCYFLERGGGVVVSTVRGQMERSRNLSFFPEDAAASESEEWRLLCLNDREQKWVDDYIAVARRLNISGDATAISIFLDEQKQQWYGLPESRRDDPGMVINIVAIAIGRILEMQCDLTWAVFESEQEHVVTLVDVSSSIIVFPQKIITQLWDIPGTEILSDYLFTMKVDIAHLQ